MLSLIGDYQEHIFLGHQKNVECRKGNGVTLSRDWANGQPIASPMILSKTFQLGKAVFHPGDGDESHSLLIMSMRISEYSWLKTLHRIK